MPTVTVPGGDPSGGSPAGGDPFAGNEDFLYIQVLEESIEAGLESGTLTALPYTSGMVAPAAVGGVVIFTTAPTTAVAIPTTDVGVVITGGATTITGGAPGETVVGGSSGVNYTNITPSGPGVTYIAVGDGANLISTTPDTTGNYSINTGAGNDTISVSGNSVINAGSGQNAVSVTGGNSLIYSEGSDTITGSAVVGGGGTDTVDIGTGQATINPGTSNFNVFEDSDATKPLFFGPGSGSDTVSAGAGGGTVYAGSGGNNILIAGAGANGAKTVLYGAANGDQLYATGSGPVVFVAGAGAETLSGAGGTLNGSSFSASTADLTFKVGSGNDVILGGSGSDTVEFSGQRADYTVETQPDGSLLVHGDGANATLSGIETLAFAVCYLRGTHILTPTGERLAEELRVGDRVVTRFGGIQTIRWIGRQSYSNRFIGLEMQPVCIRAGALGPHLPTRDLYVSPGHSMLIGDQLILAQSLVNGLTITQDGAPDEVHYYQIELDAHDCIIAEGTWSETYADGPGLRARFHNAAEFEALYPDQPPSRALRLCLPRPERGPELDAALRPLLTRFKTLPTGKLRGAIDMVEAPWLITGWAQDEALPELPVLLEILVADQVVGTALACDFRDDLLKAGIGKGRCSFELTSPLRLRPEMLHQVSIRRASDRAELLMTDQCLALIAKAQGEPMPAGIRLIG